MVNNSNMGTQQAYVPIVVVSRDRQNILGRNLLSQLKLYWSDIMLVRNLDLIHAELLTEVPNVFVEGLGKLKEMQVKINVKSETIPRFFKARPIPYALKEKVEKELDRLQQEGIEPVQFAEWATPIVPVCKFNGQLRICGDYKITINKSVVEDNYPLPRVNDLYASLAQVVWQEEGHSRNLIWVMHIYSFRSTNGHVTTLQSTRTRDCSDIPGYLKGLQSRHPYSRERSNTAAWYSTRVHLLGRHSRHWENPRRTCGESSIGLETVGSRRAETEQSKVWVLQPVSPVHGP